MSETRGSAVLSREDLEDAAGRAMADRGVDLQAVWRLAAERGRQRRRRSVRLAAMALATAAAAAALLGGVVPGVRLAEPGPAGPPAGPGMLPSSVGVAPAWTPSITERPLSRVSVVVGAVRNGQPGDDRRLPGALVLVGADQASYRLLPDSDDQDTAAAVSPDGSLVAWASRAPADDGSPGVLDVVQVSTGLRTRLPVPGFWHRGTRIESVTFSDGGRALIVGGHMYVDRYTVGPGATWRVALLDTDLLRLGSPEVCACDSSQLLGIAERADQRVALDSPQLRLVAAAQRIVEGDQVGGAASPPPAVTTASWYRRSFAQAADAPVVPPALVLLLLLGAWRVLRRPAVRDRLAGAGSAQGPDGPRRRRWWWRVALVIPVCAVLVGLVLGTVAVLGLGLAPEPARHDGFVVPSRIGEPPSELRSAFDREGEPRTTRVSLVTRNAKGAAVGLDAATGGWVGLAHLGPSPTDGMSGHLALSPNGRYVAGAPGTDGGHRDYVVVDLERARIRTVRLPFGVASGSDPLGGGGPSRNSSVAVLDDGTLAVIRLNNKAFFILLPDGTTKEVTTLGQVRSVSAQPGGRFLVHRNGPVAASDSTDGTGPRIDLIDGRTGKVVAAATDLGESNVAAVIDPEGASLAWRRDTTGEHLVNLIGGSGGTVRDSTWSSRGGVESLWPSEQGMLVGLGWSEHAPDALLRTDSGLGGSTALRPMAAVGIHPKVDEFSGLILPQLLVAGSVVAAADVVHPPSQPRWGRLAWWAIDRF